MRTGVFWASIASMKRLLKRKRSAHGTPSMELAGALSIASQMALHCPPGFDGWVTREFAGQHLRTAPEAQAGTPQYPAGDLRL
jgi:hypothetical protein